MREVALAILIVAVPSLATLLFWGVRRFGSYLDTRENLSAGPALLVRLGKFAVNAVANIEATAVPALKEATADGKLTKLEIDKLRGLALGDVKRSLGLEGLAEITDVLGVPPQHVDTFLLGEVETAHKQVKALSAQGNPK